MDFSQKKKKKNSTWTQNNFILIISRSMTWIPEVSDVGLSQDHGPSWKLNSLLLATYFLLV